MRRPAEWRSICVSQDVRLLYFEPEEPGQVISVGPRNAHVLEPVGRTRALLYRGARFPERTLDIARTAMTLADPYAA
jgi:hypothetical protein